MSHPTEDSQATKKSTSIFKRISQKLQGGSRDSLATSNDKLSSTNTSKNDLNSTNSKHDKSRSTDSIGKLSLDTKVHAHPQTDSTPSSSSRASANIICETAASLESRGMKNSGSSTLSPAISTRHIAFSPQLVTSQLNSSSSGQPSRTASNKMTSPPVSAFSSNPSLTKASSTFPNSPTVQENLTPWKEVKVASPSISAFNSNHSVAKSTSAFSNPSSASVQDSLAPWKGTNQKQVEVPPSPGSKTLVSSVASSSLLGTSINKGAVSPLSTALDGNSRDREYILSRDNASFSLQSRQRSNTSQSNPKRDRAGTLIVGSSFNTSGYMENEPILEREKSFGKKDISAEELLSKLRNGPANASEGNKARAVTTHQFTPPDHSQLKTSFTQVAPGTKMVSPLLALPRAGKCEEIISTSSFDYSKKGMANSGHGLPLLPKAAPKPKSAFLTHKGLGSLQEELGHGFLKISAPICKLAEKWDEEEYELGYAIFRKCLFEVLEGQMDFPNLMPTDLTILLEEDLTE